MTVQLVPSGVKAEKFGFMVGKVAEVSPYPSSTGAMKSLLRNDMLVKAIESQGPSIPVHVDLVEDKATRSGYKWTSSRGPDIQLSSGAVCSAYVIRETVRPITLVVPTIKRKLGL